MQLTVEDYSLLKAMIYELEERIEDLELLLYTNGIRPPESGPLNPESLEEVIIDLGKWTDGLTLRVIAHPEIHSAKQDSQAS